MVSTRGVLFLICKERIDLVQSAAPLKRLFNQLMLHDVSKRALLCSVSHVRKGMSCAADSSIGIKSPRVVNLFYAECVKEINGWKQKLC
jgi:hypothetical protein